MSEAILDATPVEEDRAHNVGTAADFPNLPQSLANKLSELAGTTEPIDPVISARLSQLGTAVAEGDMIRVATLDIGTAFDLPYFEERATDYFTRKGKTGHFVSLMGPVEWTRNFLVLLPIFLTWFELSHATNHYRILVERDRTVIDQPFLLLWEQGFNGLHSGFPFMTFSQLAALDAALLLGVVILTMWVHYISDIREAGATQRAVALRHQIEGVLWGVGQQLAVAKPRDDVASNVMDISNVIRSFQDSSRRLLDQISEEMKRLQVLREQREQEVKELIHFGDALDAGADKLIAYGDTLKEAATATSHSMEALNRLATQLDDTASMVGNEVHTLNKSSEQVAQQVSDLGQQLGRLAQEVETLAQEQSRLFNNTTRQNERMANTVSRLEEITRLFSERTDTLNSTMMRLQEAIGSRPVSSSGRVSVDGVSASFWFALVVSFMASLLLTSAVGVGGWWLLRLLVEALRL